MKDVHKPVLPQEVFSYLNPQPNGTYLDLTVGAGGHSYSLLERMNGNIRLIGVDRDKEILKKAEQHLSTFKGKYSLHHGEFSNISKVLAQLQIHFVDGVLMDIGVSSLQLDDGQRGFSFQKEGPLDMRMNPLDKLTAEHIVNRYSEEELATIIYQYGEDRRSRQIAKTIVDYREKKKIRSTLELANLILHTSKGRGKIHPATLTFQALRIEVNKELEQLENTLHLLPSLLSPQGRIVVISFHSLEDRIVKNIFKENEELHIITKKPIVATYQETKENPRARSAKLRCAEKLKAVV